MLTYQEHNQYFAQIAAGAEEIAVVELTELGATEVKTGFRGVYFRADSATLYRVNYQSRLATRVLAPLSTFDCHSANYLYKRVYELPWTKVLKTDNTFAVFANVSNSAINHSQYAALKVKDAIVDRFRDDTGKRPNVKPDDPDVWLSVYINSNKATISLETSGGSLHRRGYRLESVEAPMQETVAAAIIRMSEWDGTGPLYDPMCGSGTLLAEALMHAARIPAGYLRKRWGFTQLPDFDNEAWTRVKNLADNAMVDVPSGLIAGSDASKNAVRSARTNINALPHGNAVAIKRMRFEEIDNLNGMTIVSNPPYGVRLKSEEVMPAFMKSLGDFMKQRCGGSSAYLYFGNRELIKSIGLRTTFKRPLSNGGLDGRLAKFLLY